VRFYPYFGGVAADLRLDGPQGRHQRDRVRSDC
jgi:hypothetical protein